MANRNFNLVGAVLFVLVSIVKSEFCYYYDYILAETDFNICYNGCCDDVCCEDYWTSGSIAGAAVGSIIGTAILISILVVILRVCCATRTRGRVVYRATTPGVAVINNTQSTQIATPYMSYPQPQQQQQQPFPNPPPYTPSTSGMDNPNYGKY